ncbi:putative metalloendopeptidase M48, Ste24p [Phakopsora pachyrhizi]|uniref:Metalloendopeptidase M48, Ste24p n=1 Tax=Phakopsora pachyrhizi TaxID=170000 RepID=A0AAV0B7Z1_PHAPC|nr:putative metalloendopeptidase M48, Ste24p [Phakopsora pachyrhizi]
MFKSCLLSLTRATLIVLPFWYRWRLSRHFPRASRTLLTIPIFAMCLIIAIGIDQSPRTSRWRLLLMTESEEVEWSHRRFEDLLEAEGHLVLGADDPRTRLVKSICDRLMTAIDVDSPVSAATWPRDHIEIKEKMKRIESRKGVSPSATTGSAFMPWRPESSNPEKILDSRDWHLFIIDLPKINAFVLPTKEIFVYSGLLELLDRDEDLTAAILAHEVSHVLERHSVENMGFSALSAVLFDALRGISFALTISFPLLSDGLATFINYLNNVVAERAYSRKLETEADELGLSIMAKAGYDPREALSLWGLLNEVEQEQLDRGTLAWSDKIPWTRTHPTGKDREKAIIKGLPKAMAGYQKTIKEKIESEKILLIDNNNDKKNNNTKNYDNGDNNRDIVNVKKDKTKK